MVTPQGVVALMEGNRPAFPGPLGPVASAPGAAAGGAGKPPAAAGKVSVDALEAPAGAPRAADGSGFQRPEVEWAFFEGPTTFRASLRGKGQKPGEKPLDIRMELIGGSWKLTRIMLPVDEVLNKMGR
jgi:hypothetical protein